MSKKFKNIVSILLILLITIVNIVNPNIAALAATQGTAPSVSYTAHVQNIGWQSFVKDGGFAGTEGKSYRVEGIVVKLDAGSYTGGITYRSYVQGIGWQGYVNNGSMTGTNGQSKRLEAIQIKLTGDIANYYDVYYTVHAQNYGWLGWAKNGETSGTVGYGYRLEGIMIKLVKKGDKAPSNGDAKLSYEQSDRPFINYMTYVQNEGWKESVRNGGFSGSLGKAQRIESIIMNVDSTAVAGGIRYRAMIQGNSDWTAYVSDGAACGTNGQSKRLEAIQIELTGDLASKYDVMYRTYVEKKGWTEWVKNGETSGTIGQSLRIEAIQIQPVEKENSSVESEKSSIVGKVENASYVMATSLYFQLQGKNICQYEFKPVENAVKYEIYKCEYHGEDMDSVDSLDWKKVKETTETTCRDSDLEKGKSFLVKVRAVDSDGKVGEWSDVFEQYYFMPSFDIKLDSITSDKVNVNWNSDYPQHQVLNYEVRVFIKDENTIDEEDEDDEMGGWKLVKRIKDIPSSQCDYQITELDSGTDYLVKIDAVFQAVEAGKIVKKGSSYSNSTKGGVVFTTTAVDVSQINLNKTSLTLTEGGSETLQATIQPDNATNKTVTWSSSNTGVATVDSAGKVTAVKAGTATISAASGNGKTASCTVKVNAKTVSVTGVSITNKKDTLALDFNSSNNYYQCSATVSPSNATNKSVTWSSSNTSVATVDSNGKIKALARGIATITVKTADGSKTDSVKVYVYKSDAAVPSYSSDEWLCFQSRRDSSYVLDAAGGNSSNGTNVLAYKSNNGGSNQLWRFRQKSGGYDIYPKCSSDGKAVLDVNRGGNSYSDPIKAGLKVDLWKTGEDDAACTWKLVRLWDDDYGNAVYIIKMANYDYAIAVDSLGSQLVIKKFDVTDVNQKWTVTTKKVPTSYETKLNNLKNSGKYNSYTSWTGNYNNKAWECHGFALTIGYEISGKDPYSWSKVYTMDGVKAGDIIRFGGDAGHTIVVTKVSGNTITFVDCNGNGNYSGATKVRSNGILWDQTRDKNNTAMFGYAFSYRLVAP